MKPMTEIFPHPGEPPRETRDNPRGPLQIDQSAQDTYSYNLELHKFAVAVDLLRDTTDPVQVIAYMLGKNHLIKVMMNRATFSFRNCKV